MNNYKEQLILFLENCIKLINDDDIKLELDRILNNVKDEKVLDKEDIDYVVDNTFDKIDNSRFSDDEKRERVNNICADYNKSLSNDLSNSDNNNEENEDEISEFNLDNIKDIVSLLINEVDWESFSDNTYKKEDLIDMLNKIENNNFNKKDAKRIYDISYVLLNEGIDVPKLISNNINDYSINDYFSDLENIIQGKVNTNANEYEIDKIEDVIEENERLENNIISNNMEYAVKYLKNKIDTDYSENDNKEKRDDYYKKLDSNSIDSINEVIDDNNYYKEDLVISHLKEQIKELESQKNAGKGVKLEVTEENKEDFIKELKNILKEKYELEKNKPHLSLYAHYLNELNNKNVSISLVNNIINKLYNENDKVDLFLKVYQKNFYSISDKINKIKEFNILNDTLTKIIALERLKSQNQSNSEIEKFLNSNNKQEIQEKIKELIESNKDINFRSKEYFEKLENDKKIKSDIIDKLIKIKNSSNNLGSNNLENDTLNKEIEKKNKLINKLEYNKKLRIIRDYYYIMLDDIVDNLEKDEDFKNSKDSKKFKIIDKKVKDHPYYKVLNTNTYENKDKLINELKDDIATSLNLKKKKKKKKIKVENNKKKWYKSLAFLGGAALGVGLSFAVVPGTNGLILSGARIIYSLIKHYAKNNERIINKVTDAKNNFKEKHPHITSVVSIVNNVLKKPGVQYFMNGVAVGYTVGKIGQSVANMLGDYLPDHDAHPKKTPTVPDEPSTATDSSVAATGSDEVADVKDTVDTVIKGQRWDIGGVDNGYGFDSSTMDNRVHLNQDLAENVKIVKTKVVDGVKMVLTKSTDGDRFAWFRAEDILDGNLLNDVGKTK